MLERLPPPHSLKEKPFPVLTPPSLITPPPGKPFGFCFSHPGPPVFFTSEDTLHSFIVYASVLAHKQNLSAFFVIEYISRKEITLSQFLNLPLDILFLALGFPLSVSPPFYSSQSSLSLSKVPICYKKFENIRKTLCLLEFF